MVSIFSYFKAPLSWVSILLPLLIFVGIFIGFGFFSLFLTFTILILSSLYFTFSGNFRKRISVSAAYSEETTSKSRRSLTDSSSEFEYVEQCLRDSDVLISDEENLIEIALQTEDENPRIQKNTDFSSESILQEILADRINEEEENLIEIDISVGSIKYTRYELEA